MEAIARYRKISMSSKKVRFVIDLVRSMSVAEAINTLAHLPYKAAPYISKVLTSAMANLVYKQPKQRLAQQNVYIKEIYVNQGPSSKRIKPAPQGRAHPIRKPSCHITVCVAVKKEPLTVLTPVKEETITSQEQEVKPVVAKKQTEWGNEAVATTVSSDKGTKDVATSLLNTAEATKAVQRKSAAVEKNRSSEKSFHEESPIALDKQPEIKNTTAAAISTKEKPVNHPKKTTKE